MSDTLAILIIEDSPADFSLIRRHLKQGGLTPHCTQVDTHEGLAHSLSQGGWKLIVTDYNVPGLRFEDALTQIRSSLPEVPVVLVSGSIGEERAVESLKQGVWDIVLKDNLGRLVPSVERCLREAAERTARKSAERALLQQRQLLNAVVEGSPDAIFVKDVAGRYLLVNEAGARFVGKQVGEMIGRDDYFLFPLKTATELMAVDQAIMTSGSTHTYDENLTLLTREQITFTATKGPLYDHEGKIVGLFGIARDVTQRKQREIALAESEARFSTVFQKNPLAISVVNVASGRFMDVNEAFLRMFGYSREAIIGKSAQDLDLWPFAEERLHAIKVLNAGGQVQNLETKYRDATGHIRDALIAAEKIELAGEPCVLEMLTDITEKKLAEDRIEFLAHHDALTNLPNRLLARDRVGQAIAYAERQGHKVGLLFLDLDNFKSINDSLGHPIGDTLLKEVTRRLCASVRETDTVSRLGGDEFLIVLSDAIEDACLVRVCETILEQIAQPMIIDNNELATSCSIGATLYPNDGGDFDTLLRNADTAMYHAKDARGNNYRFFNSAMNADAIERLQLRNSLRLAVERQEFTLHYQPQIDLASGAIVGAEALIRWQHPELGLVSPGCFISIAEDCGLIVPIGEWALREACRQLASWLKADLPELVVAVNLSAIQFKRGNLEQMVLSALNDARLDPRLLELELTESILIGDSETVLQTVSSLKAIGVKLSIDDFGTGYSSLAYLKRFAVDKVKIDQSFIRDMDSDPSDEAIVRAIIQMTKELKLKTIAEGVEQQRQVDCLTLYHCDEAQGFHFGRPMPAEQFEKWVGAARHRRVSCRC